MIAEQALLISLLSFSVILLFFFQLSIIALVARVETIELAPASQIIMNATVAETSVERTAKKVCLFV